MSSSAWLGSRGVRLGVAGASAMAALALAPLTATADFTLTRCAGTDISGRGASFQNNAQQGFIELFGGAQGCSGTPIVNPYTADGSGAGRRSFGERSGTNTTGARDPVTRYAATDEAPNPTQQSQMNTGPIDGNGADLTAGDDGKVRVLPVAVGANTVNVNYPDGCTLPVASATSANGPGAGDQSARLKITVLDVEKAFAATTTTWGTLVPGIAETATGGRPAGSCAAQQIKRIVRRDDSGTTFSFKAFLNAVNGATQWLAVYGVTPNTIWPSTGGGAPLSPKAIAAGPCDAELCSGTANGGAALVSLLAATDGAIGYADVRTSRQGGFELNPAAAPATPDTTYWIQVQNKNSQQYHEPTSDPNGFKPGGNPGANCGQATFSNLPADTLGDFSNSDASNSPQGYPICVLTYILAWDDYASVYGTSDAEQSKARTVKTFLETIVGPVAQTALSARDYQALPQNLLTLAQGGVTAINFNKGGGGGTQPTPSPTPTPAPSVTPGGGVRPVPTVPPITQVSNQFSVASARVSKSGVITAVLRLPGPGVVSARAIAKRKGFTVGSATGTANAGGNLTIKLNPSRKTKAALKKTKKLKVSLSISYTPRGGTANALTRSLTLKGKVVKKKKKKKS